MEIDNIIKLIKTVSDSNLTSFQYIEENFNLTLELKSNAVSLHKIEAPPPVLNQLNEWAYTKEESNKLTVTSPMVGTFYAAKSEGSDPFISVGDIVKTGQIIGIVEAMKLMNEIECPYDGVVETIMVKNKEMVEYGQTLIILKPL